MISLSARSGGRASSLRRQIFEWSGNLGSAMTICRTAEGVDGVYVYISLYLGNKQDGSREQSAD